MGPRQAGPPGWAGLLLAVVFALAACAGDAVPLASPSTGSIPPASVSPSASGGAPPSVTPSPLTTPTPTATIAPTLAPTPPPTSPIPTILPTATPTLRPTATPRPTVAPTPRPTPRPTATPAPTPSPSSPSKLVRNGSRTSNDVALTFDMGGRVGDALAIVDWLVAHSVHATIFMTGAMADNKYTDAGRQVLAIIDDHPDLLTLGNHSYAHPDFRTLTAAEMVSELRRTETAIAPHCSQDPRPFFRPPYGGTNASVLATVGSADYRWTVLWDIDTIDWRPIVNDPPGPTADEIVAKVLGNAQGGSIVLMHLGGYETYKALPSIVTGLEGAGFDLVNLDTMLGG